MDRSKITCVKSVERCFVKSIQSVLHRIKYGASQYLIFCSTFWIGVILTRVGDTLKS
jgi:hypothetical protein